ncbi:MAG: UDP-glucose 4-epimerase [Parcubacteria bacterium C7867-004]|nr:MAG: UDP-glucose 4-epimerase [Parcubacteria bacterium C7867-004]
MSKTILVTGGAGFIGSNLCKRLVNDGHRVISLDNYFAGSQKNHVPGVEYREGHTKDIEQHVSETPDVVYHLGEYSRVEQSVLEPDVVFDLNTEGTKGVIAFWKKRRCKLVYAGSSTKFADEGLDKETVPYVATKAANTELVKAVGDSEGLSYAITYFYNVYGPGERAGVYGTVIEAFKQMYQEGVPFTITSPGTQARNFTHVDDIVDGLVLVGEHGQGDEYGLGNERIFTILEVANLFGGDVVMLPARSANRTLSKLDTSKSRSLGWNPTRELDAYISDFRASCPRGVAREKRVLVFSTTFYPIMGPAEQALVELMRQMPDVSFDIVTAAFAHDAHASGSPVANAQVHRVGFGHPVDKYLLPILGSLKGMALQRTHRYLFAWALMASYGALAGILVRRLKRLPLLTTLADQRLENISPIVRLLLRLILSETDQVYGIDATQEAQVQGVARRALARTSIGEGDAFANQLRYAYAQTLIALKS